MFPVTLQKSFNLAFEAPPNSDGASPYMEQAVMHFLFALERYLRTLPAAKATAVEQKIKDHEMRFRRPNDLCVLQELASPYLQNWNCCVVWKSLRPQPGFCR